MPDRGYGPLIVVIIIIIIIVIVWGFWNTDFYGYQCLGSGSFHESAPGYEIPPNTGSTCSGSDLSGGNISGCGS